MLNRSMLWSSVNGSRSRCSLDETDGVLSLNSWIRLSEEPCMETAKIERRRKARSLPALMPEAKTQAKKPRHKRCRSSQA